MKLHHYIIIICSFIIVAFVAFNFITQRTIAVNQTNIEYANYLTAACHDAAKTIDIDKIDESVGVWRNRSDIDYTLSIFYETLARNFGSKGDILGDIIKQKTPFVALIDTNGFYISYNAVFDKYDNSVISASSEDVNVVSEINTWTETVGTCIVRYYLSDYVQIILDNNEVYSGNRYNVYKQLSLSGLLIPELDYLINDNDFNNSKNHAIITKIEQQLNYYANTQLINVNDYCTGYNITLPEIEGEYWARMIKSPSVISFMQGEQQILTGNLLNVYAYAAGELTSKIPYFVDSDDYYHRLDNELVTTVNTTVTINGVDTTVIEYYFNGNPITEFYSSMEECAKAGAVPAPDEY